MSNQCGQLNLLDSKLSTIKTFPLKLGVNVIGSSPQASIRLYKNDVLPMHFFMEVEENKMPIISTFSSIDATYLNDKLLRKGKPEIIKPSDTISFSNIRMVYENNELDDKETIQFKKGPTKTKFFSTPGRSAFAFRNASRHSLKAKKTAQPWRWDVLDKVLLPSSPLAQTFNKIKTPNQNDEISVKLNDSKSRVLNTTKPKLEQSVSKQETSSEEQLSKSMAKLMKIASKRGRPSRNSTLQSDSSFFSLNDSVRSNIENESDPNYDAERDDNVDFRKDSDTAFDKSTGDRKRLSPLKSRSAVTVNKYLPNVLNSSTGGPQSNDLKATLSLSFNFENGRGCLPKLTQRSKSMHLNTLIDFKKSRSILNRSNNSKIRLLKTSSTPKLKQPLTAFLSNQTPIIDKEKSVRTSSKTSKTVYEDTTPTVTSNSFVYEYPLSYQKKDFVDTNISGVGVLEADNETFNSETSEGDLGVKTDYWSPIYCSSTGTDESDVSIIENTENLNTPRRTSAVKNSKSLTTTNINSSVTPKQRSGFKQRTLTNTSMQDIRMKTRRTTRNSMISAGVQGKSSFNVSTGITRNANVSKSDIGNDTSETELSKLKTPKVTQSPKFENVSGRKTLLTSVKKRSSSTNDLTDVTSFDPSDTLTSSDKELVATPMEIQDIKMNTRRSSRKNTDFAGIQNRSLFNVSTGITGSANVSKLKTPNVNQSSKLQNVSNLKTPTSIIKRSSSTNNLTGAVSSNPNDTLDSISNELIATPMEMQDIKMKIRRSSRKNTSFAGIRNRSLLNASTDLTENANILKSDIGNAASTSQLSKLKTPVSQSSKFQNLSNRKSLSSIKKRSSTSNLTDAVISNSNDTLESSIEELVATPKEMQGIEMKTGRSSRKNTSFAGMQNRSLFNVSADLTENANVSKSDIGNTTSKSKTLNATQSPKFKDVSNRKSLLSSIKKRSSTSNLTDAVISNSNDTLESSIEELVATPKEIQGIEMKTRRSFRKNTNFVGIQNSSLVNMSTDVTENANVSKSYSGNTSMSKLSNLKMTNLNQSPKYQNVSRRKTQSISIKKLSSSATDLTNTTPFKPNDILESSVEELIASPMEMQDIEMKTRRTSRRNTNFADIQNESLFNISADLTENTNVLKSDIGNTTYTSQFSKSKTPNATQSPKFQDVSNRKSLLTSIKKRSSLASNLTNTTSEPNDTLESNMEELVVAPTERSRFKTSKTSKSSNAVTPKPLNDLSDVRGVKRLFKTPKPTTEPSNDLHNVAGIKHMFLSPKEQKSPNNDLTDVRGVKKLLKTPKLQKEPLNDLKNIAGLKKLFLSASRKQRSPKNDLSDIKGVKRLLRTPKPIKSPTNDLTDVTGVKKMFGSTKKQISPNNDLTNVRGVRDLMRTPKICSEDLNEVYSVGRLFKQKSPTNDLSNIHGVKALLKTPKNTNPPKDDLCDVEGVKNVFASAQKVRRSSKNDLSDVRGVTDLMKTKKQQNIVLDVTVPTRLMALPEKNIKNSGKRKCTTTVNENAKKFKSSDYYRADYTNVAGIKRMFAEAEANYNSKMSVSGVADLFTDKFDKLIGKEPLRQYPGKNSPTKLSPLAKCKTILDSSIKQNSHVERWLQEQTMSLPNTSTPINKGKREKFIPDFLSSEIHTDRSKGDNSTISIQKSKKIAKPRAKREFYKKNDNEENEKHCEEPLKTSSTKPKVKVAKRRMCTRAMKKNVTLEKDHEEKTEDQLVVKPKSTRGRKPKAKAESNLQEAVKTPPLNVKRTRSRVLQNKSVEKKLLNSVEDDKQNVSVKTRKPKSKGNSKKVVVDSTPKDIEIKINNEVSPRRTRGLDRIKNINEQDKKKITRDSNKTISTGNESKTKPTRTNLRKKNDEIHTNSIIVIDSSLSSNEDKDENKLKPTRSLRSKKNIESNNNVHGLKRKVRTIEKQTEDKNDVESRVNTHSSILTEEETNRPKRTRREQQIENENPILPRTRGLRQRTQKKDGNEEHPNISPKVHNRSVKVNSEDKKEVPLKRRLRKRGTKI